MSPPFLPVELLSSTTSRIPGRQSPPPRGKERYETLSTCRSKQLSLGFKGPASAGVKGCSANKILETWFLLTL